MTSIRFMIVLNTVQFNLGFTIKETWGDLTDDEITQLEGNRQKLSGKIQERYGRAEDVVEKEIDDWSTRHDYRF